MIALVRTSGSPEDRHKGLSQFIIDLSLPGVTIRPIEDLTGDAPFLRGLLRRCGTARRTRWSGAKAAAGRR
jgi:alkylation response protein AidB-like acyl-CoA dehydrogenase